MKTDHVNMWIVVAVMVACTVVQPVSAAVVFSDDFSTNPFPARWQSVYQAGFNETTYGWEAGVMTRWGDGAAHAQVVNAPVANATIGYAVDFDVYFDAATSQVGRRFGVTVQNQANGSHYEMRAYVGGDDAVDWESGADVYNTKPNNMSNVMDSIYEGQILTGQWYTFHAEVLDTGSQIELKAVVYDKGTSTIAVPWSATAIDSSAGRYTTGGYGMMQYQLTKYLDPGTALDNFVVTVVPEPASLALLALAGVALLRRRR